MTEQLPTTDQPTADERPNLMEAAYEQLIDILIRGELRPGDVITERKMGERLNASRTPIREALSRLEAEGLVFKQANRGVTVSPFSAEAFIEILNVRQLLEGEAARLAAGSLSKAKIAGIREALAALDANPSPSLSEIWDVDDMLHGAIAEAGNNQLMASLIRDLRRRTHVFNAYRNQTRPGFAIQDNADLLDAIESGDRERSRDAMVEHIAAVKTALIEKLTGI